MSSIAASPFSAGQLSTLLGVTSPTQDVANGLSDLLAPTAGNPIGAMSGILESLTPASRSTGVASHFGPAATLDLGTAIEKIQLADNSANAAVDQTLQNSTSSASSSASQTAGQSTGATVDISA